MNGASAPFSFMRPFRLPPSAFLLCCALEAGTAIAQHYPSRPVRMIAGVAPGGGLDTICRAAAQMLTDKLGQTFVVDNRPGGGTVLAMEVVAQAAPDGHTLLCATDTTYIVGASKRVTYDVRKAYVPIVQMTTQSYMVMMTPALPIQSIKDLIAYAKAKPGALSYGSSGIGTTSHLGLERFDLMAGTKMVHVPYKGAAPAMLDILSGQIHLVLASSISATPHIKSGRLRSLGTTGLKRVPAFPDLPTVAETLPGFKVTNTYNLFAPAGTSRSVADTLNRTVGQGMRSPEMMKRLAGDGSEPAEPNTPEQFRNYVAREYEEVEKLLKTLNLKLF
jgi:tripartite-type tricarboxylate transporter receptor subunit TctC